MGAAARRKKLRRTLMRCQSQQGETAKISQRLIQIAQPYLNGEDDLDEYQKELTLASTAWNLSLFPPDSREEHMMKSLAALPGRAPTDRGTSPRVGAAEGAVLSRGSACDRKAGCARRRRHRPGSRDKRDLKAYSHARFTIASSPAATFTGMRTNLCAASYLHCASFPSNPTDFGRSTLCTTHS
jgi:hypothetical protein